MQADNLMNFDINFDAENFRYSSVVSVFYVVFVRLQSDILALEQPVKKYVVEKTDRKERIFTRSLT